MSDESTPSPGEGQKIWRPKGYEECDLLHEHSHPGDHDVGIPDVVTRVWFHAPSKSITLVQSCEPDYFNVGPDELRMDLSLARAIGAAIARLPDGA